MRGTYLPEEGEVRVRANRASCNPSRLGLGWGLYLWIRVVSWPCGKTKLMRAHARGGKLGLRVRVIGVRVRRSLVGS